MLPDYLEPGELEPLEGEPWDEYRKDSDCENRFNSDLFDTEDFDDDLD